MKVVDDFDSRQTVCWATTFTFDPGYFETFLLRRLGEPPINATVLVDHARLAATWERMDPAEAWRVRRANRDYLVRGVMWPGGAFHAKTILLGNEKGGTLLVGSGNISLAGLDHGHEIYARFRWSEPVDKSAFGTWRAWMEAVVAHVDDALVRYRWADLLGRLPWLPAVAEPSAFTTNRAQNLLDQLASTINAPVDLLIATAPFFDTDLRALAAAVERFRPARVELRLGERPSVDGPKLRAFLEGLEVPWQVASFVPRTYVHAKLLGVVWQGRARVLAGSANLSAPALLRAWSDHGANLEAGVIVEADADRAMAWFDAGTGTELLDLAEIEQLALAKPAVDLGYPVRLVAAHVSRDRRIHLEVGAGAKLTGLCLTDGASTWDLDDSVTRMPVALAERPLLWLVDAVREARSNRVPLDDRGALQSILDVRVSTADRPSELDEDGAVHPLGRLLTELYRSALFDIDETAAAKQAAALAGSDASRDDAFWDQFMRDQIRLDPRISRYHAWAAAFHGLPPADEFRWLIEQMLARAPKPGEFRLLDGSVIAATSTDAASSDWEPSRRTLTSALNALKRWALALNDPRVRWLVADYAPIDHYERLVGTIWQIWVQGPSWPEARPTLSGRLAALVRTLFDAFVGVDHGYLATLSEEERGRALELLGTGRMPEIAAALAYAALSKASAADFFAWQPSLVPALELGVLAPSPATTDLVEQVLGTRPTLEAVAARLRLVATYTDNAHWSADVAASIGFGTVQVMPSGHHSFALGVAVEPGVDLVFDRRIVRLLRRALEYKNARSVRLTSGPNVLSAALNGSVNAGVGGRTYASLTPLTAAVLAELEHEGGSLASLLDEDV